MIPARSRRGEMPAGSFCEKLVRSRRRELPPRDLAGGAEGLSVKEDSFGEKSGFGASPTEDFGISSQ
ncbi:MAG TPA: hypothetical protein IAB26_12770 [Candidatus Limivivens merdigallinarum]|uniref:Uncharacterized protein n=1 Tax=Candidatus Limivivens merdigallinarum TaxID=2840859 RepID=A0A9D0ZXX7_9FIRM|nr:hypothetical protein [Candidatus Limivivens merdigallinarum]